MRSLTNDIFGGQFLDPERLEAEAGEKIFESNVFHERKFSFFQQDKYITNLTTNDKSIHGLVGIRTMGGRMVSKDESIELWRHPLSPLFFFVFFVG